MADQEDQGSAPAPAQQQQQQQLTPEQMAALQQQMVDLRAEPYRLQAVAIAQFLRHLGTLKNKSGVLDGKRVEYFKGKNALQALQSELYQKARHKNQHLPEVTSLQQAGEAMRLLPIHLLALRVDLLEKEKTKKAGQTKSSRKLEINRQQEISEDHHYVWFYEYIPLTTKLAGFGLLALVFSVIMYPLWPPKMRVGVYYLSWLALGFIAFLAVTAVVRLILYVITMFTTPPGIWLFPNLFEDVGFFDSFKPLWAWHEDKAAKKAAKKAKREAKEKKVKSTASATAEAATADASHGVQAAASAVAEATGAAKPRAAYVEDAEDDE